ncbi:MAG: type II toxin-antitoxin system HicB family antitoxin [Candidatus Portnoybacteria bacterium]|nr:type II toxin-antitoxin system HicB family antitoxin [Candidatus Portnoybacteria bacterium]
MFNPFKKDEVIPRSLVAYKWRCPDKIEVSIKPSKDGGYIVYVNDLPGCITQAENGEEIFEMVNDAIYTYLEIPRHYQPYMPIFIPPEELRKQLDIKIPEKYLKNPLVLQRT